ncbi:MAG: hypothetical protein A2W93_05110 [Bacteroidetes bacterium GWF2_43_63]|nr:MAG: hypothetical protein A2W94_12040 [Bacteroidetes bacterium GWE2_42_42]OFY56255.1 MAG: hypothetical protein A2W93_05110 [Bacteroidetes bacterium GWF2_43_63]HBG71931.1 hypothetical protein [Bacteroidales bacterium]HCB61832.1 hypothetical protein [Bacteroidales bacterium]HCY23854.1 hypothetical protein [Bacteroidales bacterium]
MSRHIVKILIIVLSAAAFTILFYRAGLGLNLVVFEAIMALMSCFLFRKSTKRNHVWYLFQLLLLISVVSVLITHTAYAITINIFLFLQFMAMQLWPAAARIHLLSLITPLNIFPSLSKGFLAITKIRKPTIFQKWPGVWLTVASLLVIWLFISLYSASNNYFSKLVGKVSSFVSDIFNTLFNFENADILIYVLMGLIIAAALLIRTDIAEKLNITNHPGINLIRKKGNILFKSSFKGFMKWFRTGVFLMFALNFLILIFNYLDLRHVWFGFEWNGQLLREFVHEGTWTLVFCVALSAVLALLFFNGKIPFYSKNKILKLLVKIWVAQNIFMIASVFIRNLRYVEYYNLASLRIGVFIFLIIAVFALIALLMKINYGRNMFWLLKNVFVFTSIILTISSAPDWNRVIMRYNISHRNSAYFHHDYMVMLPHCIDILHENRNLFDYPYNCSRYHSYTGDIYGYNSVTNYDEIIDLRMEAVHTVISDKDWREWNYADFRILRYLENH